MSKSTSERVGQGRIKRRLAPPLFFGNPSLNSSAAPEQAVKVVLGNPLIGAAVLKQEAGKR
jgi:hypothetical protein